MSTASKRWEWAEHVMGPNGPADHRQRLTAMALFMHMNEQGQCWVGQPRIAERTGFGERSVRRHVQTLERHGWIQRSLVKGAGKAWRRTIYTASLPPSLASPDQSSEAAANRTLHLADAPADEVPDHVSCDQRINGPGAAKLEEGPAKSSEGAANSLSGAANRWPVNRDLEQGIEPVSRTSLRDSEKAGSLLKSPLRESKKTKNRDFEAVLDRVQRVLVEFSLKGEKLDPKDTGLIAKVTALSEAQVRAAVHQLLDRGRLPIP